MARAVAGAAVPRSLPALRPSRFARSALPDHGTADGLAPARLRGPGASPRLACGVLVERSPARGEGGGRRGGPLLAAGPSAVSLRAVRQRRITASPTGLPRPAYAAQVHRPGSPAVCSSRGRPRAARAVAGAAVPCSLPALRPSRFARSACAGSRHRRWACPGPHTRSRCIAPARLRCARGEVARARRGRRPARRSLAR